MKTQLLVLFGALFAGLTSAAYSEATGIKSVYYAAAAYCSASSLESWTCGPACQENAGLTKVRMITDDAKGTFGWVGYNPKDDQIVVSFRGSVNE